MTLRTCSLFLLFVGCARLADAHPVAQGSLEVRVDPGVVSMSWRVSNEQVFVASGFGSPAVAARTLEELWRDHGRYLLAHVFLEADGVRSTGEVLEVVFPQDRSVKGFVVYELQFPFTAPDARPARLSLRQDLLNEFEFAPGNRWEATFVVRLIQQEQVVREAVLWSAQQPILWDLNWNTHDQTAPVLSPGRIARDYAMHGLHHILVGWDHLLFMAALVLAVTRLWELVAVVTAFTIAHTVTVTLATLRLVHLPSSIVEPMIAASIVAVALQNLWAPRQARGWPRLAIAFGFGLFHGLGFAGGLLDAMADLPAIAITTAIVAFSVGVELGHQVVALPLFGLVALFRRIDARTIKPGKLTPRTRQLGSALVSVAGVYYLVLALR
jgi:hydrogenase/urease accessory protein HupE